jgi:hypothetical protein
MRTAVLSRQASGQSITDKREELRLYLSSPVEEVDDVVKWWGVRCCFSRRISCLMDYQHHAQQYPTLSKMARDYLAIQGSATPSERAFSSGGLTGTTRRNRLNAETFEALQLLKGDYRSGALEIPDDSDGNESTMV